MLNVGEKTQQPTGVRPWFDGMLSSAVVLGLSISVLLALTDFVVSCVTYVHTVSWDKELLLAWRNLKCLQIYFKVRPYRQQMARRRKESKERSWRL